MNSDVVHRAGVRESPQPAEVGEDNAARIHRGFIAPCSHESRSDQRKGYDATTTARPQAPDPVGASQKGGGRGRVTFQKLMKVNHPAPGDVVGNPAHVAGYGTAFEGTISLRVRDDDGTVIAEGFAQGAATG